MKRFVLFVALFALAVVPASAQLSYGLHGGGDFASYTGLDENYAETTEWAPGFNIGANVDYDITDIVGEFVDVEKFTVGGTVGFAMFMPADDEFDLGGGSNLTLSYSMSAIYIEFDATYFINEKAYAVLGLGITPYSLSVEAESDNPFLNAAVTGTVEGETKTGPMIGVGYMLTDNIAVEAKAGNSHIRANVVYLLK
jgi:outer membrane protein W